MTEKQHTIHKPVSVSGVGLHIGKPVTLTFQPADEHHGIVFQRTDLPDNPLIPADVDLVVDTSRGTTIGISKEARVHTVEHTLAALMGLQIDNVLVQLDGPEPPAMDGSSKAYVEALKTAAVVEQEAERIYFVIDEPIHFQDAERGVQLAAMPSEGFKVTTMIEFESDFMPAQHAVMESIEDFEAQFSNSRTFCFLHEVEALHQAGLIQGASLESAVVVMDRDIDQDTLDNLKTIYQTPDLEIKEGYLNSEGGLRHDNEPARHKLLDLVGDLALVGMPIKGHVMANRPGHKANVALAKAIKNKIKQNKIARKFQKGKKQGLIFDINAIHEILPHRYPFLLVDRILEFSENTITGQKNVTINEPFFQGHFPGNPIMPGVLQLEAMAQVGGILLLNTIDNPKSIWVYFVAIDNARFKKPVIPGDTLILELELTALKRSICKMTGRIFVDGHLVCSADLIASVVPKHKL